MELNNKPLLYATHVAGPFGRFLRRLLVRHREREAEARRRNARLRANGELYLRDYRGRLYLYHEGRPIVPADSFKDDPFRVLDEARTASVLFDCLKE